MTSAAVEVHNLDASTSLVQLRELFRQVGLEPLQTVAALDADSLQGLALVIYSSEPAANAAVELFNGYPLGTSFLHVKRADSLPNSLINLLYSLDQASGGSQTVGEGSQGLGAQCKAPPNDRRQRSGAPAPPLAPPAARRSSSS